MGIEERIREAVARETGLEIGLQDIRKNNGVIKATLTYKVSPNAQACLHIESVIQALEAGEDTFENAVKSLANTISENRDFIPDMTGLNREMVLDKVTYLLVNRGANQYFEENCPHREYLDLLVLYQVDFGYGVAKITNNMMSAMELTQEELEAAAKANTDRIKNFRGRRMYEVMAEMCGMPEDVLEENAPGLWVMTSGDKHTGASIMLYPEKFREVADKEGCDLYILPSSIHEVLALPGKDVSVSELREMVGAVNTNEVSADEVLSGSVYRYDRSTGEIEVA